MTPLAQRYANESVLPPKDRTLKDPTHILALMPRASCFEMTAIKDVMSDFSRAFIEAKLPDPDLAFLPHKLTWLEWKTDDGGRQGFMLQDTEDGSAAFWFVGEVGARLIGKLALKDRIIEAQDDPDLPIVAQYDVGKDLDPRRLTAWAFMIYGLLACINTPRYIGRRTYDPHAGLARKLAKAAKMEGKFPLRAWTEIRLEWMPEGDGEAAPKETRLTGEKAYHKVRAHWKKSQGIHVREHWKGNPALGIVQSRYRVTNEGART